MGRHLAEIVLGAAMQIAGVRWESPFCLGMRRSAPVCWQNPEALFSVSRSTKQALRGTLFKRKHFFSDLEKPTGLFFVGSFNHQPTPKYSRSGCDHFWDAVR